MHLIITISKALNINYWAAVRAKINLVITLTEISRVSVKIIIIFGETVRIRAVITNLTIADLPLRVVIKWKVELGGSVS